MRLYSCKVRLKNSLYNEVPKIGVSAAEIIVLQHVHSVDNGETIDTATVVDIAYTGDVDRSDAEERARLSRLYDGALKKQNNKSIMQMFGVGVPLPTREEGDSGLDKAVEPIVKRGLDPSYEPSSGAEPVVKRGPGRPKRVEAEQAAVG